MAIDLIIADSIQQTITECVEVIGNNFALDTLKLNGVVSMEEVNTVRAIATKILTEGQEDFIPENLEIPDMPAAPMGVAEDTTESLEDLDLDVSDLEGIVLATAEGTEFVIQDGILVPFTLGGTGDAMALDVSEDEDDALDAVAAQNAANPGTEIGPDLADGGQALGDVEEVPTPVATETEEKPEEKPEEEETKPEDGEEESEEDKKKKLEESEDLGQTGADIITENSVVSTAKVSSIVQSLILDLNLTK